MAISTTLLLALYTVSGIASAAFVPSDGFEIGTERREANRHTVDALSEHRQKQSGVLAATLGKSLYWFGYFSVGLGAKPYRLLIDTGSTDLILNPGLYKPSSHSKSYGTGKFSISYEGVNRDGFGFETINGTTYRDNVTAAGFTVEEQPQGQAKTYKYFDVPQLPYPTQGQGIIGFAGASSSSFNPPADSWFWNLCKEKQLKVCKLGLVFGTSGKGVAVVGKLAKKYLKGDLVQVAGGDYMAQGDVTLDNKIVLKNQTLIMDVGTDNIQGPYGSTKKLLAQLGYQLREQTGPNIFDPKHKVKVVTGFFECNKPPVLGFSFPAEADLKDGEKATIFNVSPDVWDVYDHGKNNCTSILGGTNALGGSSSKMWLLGQPFFAGHYIDFDITTNKLGYGFLKNPFDPSKSS